MKNKNRANEGWIARWRKRRAQAKNSKLRFEAACMEVRGAVEGLPEPIFMIHAIDSLNAMFMAGNDEWDFLGMDYVKANGERVCRARCRYPDGGKTVVDYPDAASLEVELNQVLDVLGMIDGTREPLTVVTGEEATQLLSKMMGGNWPGR